MRRGLLPDSATFWLAYLFKAEDYLLQASRPPQLDFVQKRKRRHALRFLHI
ncbi:hypothetical protein [Thermoactinomyces sp. DSM 45892]|uniref:hypothetical protein n=1 Tax=Thermoactinomyces sp. DSM 45892 TaxID=1882753 RepID=UPI0015A4DE43|nr:hypothetical protein [Thermoactinomyces sp. DSM 45892]